MNCCYFLMLRNFLKIHQSFRFFPMYRILLMIDQNKIWCLVYSHRNLHDRFHISIVVKSQRLLVGNAPLLSCELKRTRYTIHILQILIITAIYQPLVDFAKFQSNRPTTRTYNRAKVITYRTTAHLPFSKQFFSSYTCIVLHMTIVTTAWFNTFNSAMFVPV